MKVERVLKLYAHLVLHRKDERVFPSRLSVYVKVERAGVIFVRIFGYFQRKTFFPFLGMATIDEDRYLFGLFPIVHGKKAQRSCTIRPFFAFVRKASMQTSPNEPTTRPGTPGLDVFKIAGRSISGFVHSFKTGDPRRVRQPFTSHLEERLSMFLEYHPHVRFYQRGDASPACASTYGLVTDLGTPYRINYVFEGKPHDYLPDFVGTLCDGGLLIAEAGRESEKSKGKALLKAEAARRLALLKGGVYWLGVDTHLSERRHQNWLYLHARRQAFPTYQEIAEVILAHWAWRDMCSVHEFVQRWGPHWSEQEVEAAVWKLVGDAAAEGRLLVDLTEVELSHGTLLALLEPGSSPILPDPLPSSLEEVDFDTPFPQQADEGDVVLDPRVGIPGPTFDASVLASTEEQILFNRHLAAVTAVLAGMGVSKVAHAYGMGKSTLSRLVRRTKELGLIHTLVTPGAR